MGTLRLIYKKIPCQLYEIQGKTYIKKRNQVLKKSWGKNNLEHLTNPLLVKNSENVGEQIVKGDIGKSYYIGFAI